MKNQKAQTLKEKIYKLRHKAADAYFADNDRIVELCVKKANELAARLEKKGVVA